MLLRKGVAVTYGQLWYLASKNGISRYRKRFYVNKVLQNKEAVELIVSNMEEACRRFGLTHAICQNVRKHLGVSNRFNFLSECTKKLREELSTVSLPLTSKELGALTNGIMKTKLRTDYTKHAIIRKALEEGWLVRSINTTKKFGFAYGDESFRGRTIQFYGREFHFDEHNRSLGEVLYEIVDSHHEALTIEEMKLLVRDTINLTYDSVILSHAVRTNPRISKWGRGVKLSRGYLYFCRPEQLNARLAKKETILPPATRRVYENTRRQCITLQQACELCMLPPGTVGSAIQKLTLLGMRQTEIFKGERLIWDPSLSPEEIELSKIEIEKEISRRVAERQIVGDYFAAWASLCLILDQINFNLAIEQIEVHFGSHAYASTDLRIVGRRGLTREKIIAEVKGQETLRAGDIRKFVDKLRHQHSVTKALLISRKSSRHAFNVISSYHDRPLQLVNASMIRDRYEELINKVVTASDFEAFCRAKRVTWIMLKDMLENRPAKLKEDLTSWLETHDNE